MSEGFPVAATAEAALHAPLGRATREREAASVAGGGVEFVTQWVGPAFASLTDAEAAYAAPANAAFCSLRPVTAEGADAAALVPVAPERQEGRRWPQADAAPAARWRLSVSFWRPRTAQAQDEALELDAARRLRRDEASAVTLDARALRRLTSQPLRPVRAQQPLDIGLFEVRLPERPEITIPDE